MAVIASSQVSNLYAESSGAQRSELLRLSNVSTGDTIDLAQRGPNVYRKVQAAVFFGADQKVGVVGSVSGTVVTITSAGLANDSVLLLATGVV